MLPLVAIFNIRTNRTRYFPIEKNEVYLVASLFVVVFILGNIWLAYLASNGDLVSALLRNPPLVNYGTILTAYSFLALGIIHLVRKKGISLSRLINTRIRRSIFYTYPLILVLVLVIARSFGYLSGTEVFVLSAKWSDVAYPELFVRTICYSILVPLGEELYFRGVVYSALQNYYNKSAAIILVSGYFAIGHLAYSPTVLLWFFLVGLIYTGLYEGYKSLLPGMILHGFLNIPTVLR
jgi:membrane protease YdiL (CAAX protease family)